MTKSAFRLTVPESLFEAVSLAVDQSFADSYLFGATLNGLALTPRTLTGYGKMKDRSQCMKVLRGLGITLIKPTPWPGDGERLGGSEAW